jgi:hypothetical protein
MTTDTGFWQGILETAHGRGQFRFILQPAVAILLGIRLGIADAKAHDQPFLMRMLVKGEHKARIAKEAAKSVLIPFVIAVLLDALLQYITLDRVRPLAAVVVGALLIWLPFSISRSLTNRIYRHSRLHHHEAT